MKTFRYIFINTVILIIPTLVLAQSFDRAGRLGRYVDGIVGFINDALIPLFIGLAFLVFLYGIYNYFFVGGSSDDEADDARKKGKSFILVGSYCVCSDSGFLGHCQFLSKCIRCWRFGNP